MRRAKSLFLIFLALWLPWQAAGAVVMPLQFAQEHDVRVEVADAGDCHAAGEEAAADDCDSCRICHLATAGFLLAPLLPRVALAADVLVAPPVSALPSHIGEPPWQPPRRSN